MNPALQFLELVDKNAVSIFNEFIDANTTPKIKKEPKPKPIKVVKVKEIKVKEVKVKKVKSQRKKKEQTTIDIINSNPKEKSALDILIEIKNKKKTIINDNSDNYSIIIENVTNKDKYIKQIKSLLDDINDFMDKNKCNFNIINSTFDIELLNNFQKVKEFNL
jgi:hypothetical protein